MANQQMQNWEASPFMQVPQQQLHEHMLKEKKTARKLITAKITTKKKPVEDFQILKTPDCAQEQALPYTVPVEFGGIKSGFLSD